MTVAPLTDNTGFSDLLKTRSREAFSELYNKYSGALFGIICKIVQNKAVCEELLQDVFLKIWKNIDKYDSSKGSLFVWMLNIARNTSIDHLRSTEHKMQMHTQQPQQDTLAVPVTMQNKAENEEVRGLAFKPEHKYKQVIDLLYFGGYTQEEVAQILQIPLDTVKTRGRAGLQQLRTLYENTNKN
jgi:RNA polymerase sigma-70 factor (ECF subfamily)